MATLREIKQRISGIKSTQKITKAMKMVAAAKLRRAQDAVVAARPYAKKMKELFNRLTGFTDISTHPLLTIRPVNNVAVIIITADRGLCGGFNSNLIRSAVYHIQTIYGDMNAAGKVKLFCVGKKGSDFFQKNDYKIANRYLGIFQDLHFDHARSVINDVVKGFLSGEYDKVEIVYNEFKSLIQQRVIIDQILPITPVVNQSSSATDISHLTSHISSINYIYERSIEAIISSLVPKHLNFRLWHALLESNAAEQGARMSAMDNATTNASELIRSLQLHYNKARQASITKELLEIVSGAEALKNA
ncbi:MAG: ATP synthase F1 subunit gamma [Bacteroidota bacterium]|nr:ATP synthase F1 subunit gamma [Bacteroidota bacterium]